MSPLVYLSLIAALPVDGKVCKSLDVRNTPEHISEFKHCRVIEGHLQVVLIERSDVTDFLNNSFTELYEITEYLIIYRVMGLPSLDVIFPKLTSIKGEKLFMGFALVLYDLRNLREIKLTSLRTIGNGGVKINTCPDLCYVDTVNWEALGVSYLAYDRQSECEGEGCPLHCGGYCWSDYECQNLAKSNCHSLCMGCTKSDSPRHCLSCKYFNDSGTCVQKCPSTKLVDEEFSRCLTVVQCADQHRSVFNGTCIETCPDFYEADKYGLCKRTNIKLCQGIQIHGYMELDHLRGCTHINGSLDLVLDDYIDSRFLERGLGRVVHITGYLKISHSDSIMSLDFFKSLTIIMGRPTELWSRYYSLFIIENPNLQKLFHENATPKILGGEALFQNNPHLCQSEIDKINITKISVNNGGKCMPEFNCFKIVVKNNSTNVTISWWLPYNVTVVGGYTIYYTKIHPDKFNPVQIKEVFFDKDGLAYEPGWNSVFTPNTSVLISRLTPYTHYAYYIQTMFSPEGDNLQSPISYFQTATDDPSEPDDVETESQNETTVTLQWKPPRQLNGDLSHYILTLYRQEDYPLVGQRNFCTQPYEDSSCCRNQDEPNVFLQQGDVCLGLGDHYCYAKTAYQTDVPLRISKRSVNPVNQTGQFFREYIIKGTETSFIVNKLKPFTMYTFFMQACNRKDKGDGDHCGGFTMTFQRTQIRSGDDLVTDVSVRVENTTVIVNWTKPKDPSLPILAYRVEYTKVGLQSLMVECRTEEEFIRERGVVLEGLNEGSYMVRVGVVSLAGYGEVRDWKHFEVWRERNETLESNETRETTDDSREDGDGQNSSTSGWVYGILGLLGVMVVSGLGFAIWRRYQEARDANDPILIPVMRPDNDEWKLDDETVEIIEELGKNYVGILYRNS